MDGGGCTLEQVRITNNQRLRTDLVVEETQRLNSVVSTLCLENKTSHFFAVHIFAGY